MHLCSWIFCLICIVPAPHSPSFTVPRITTTPHTLSTLWRTIFGRKFAAFCSLAAAPAGVALVILREPHIASGLCGAARSIQTPPAGAGELWSHRNPEDVKKIVLVAKWDLATLLLEFLPRKLNLEEGGINPGFDNFPASLLPSSGCLVNRGIWWMPPLYNKSLSHKSPLTIYTNPEVSRADCAPVPTL